MSATEAPGSSTLLDGMHDWSCPIMIDPPKPGNRKPPATRLMRQHAERVFARARQAQPEILSWGLKKRLEFITRLKTIIIARQAVYSRSHPGRYRQIAHRRPDGRNFRHPGPPRLCAEKCPQGARRPQGAHPAGPDGQAIQDLLRTGGYNPDHIPLELPLLPGHRAHQPGVCGGQRRDLQALQRHPAQGAGRGSARRRPASIPPGSRWSTAAGRRSGPPAHRPSPGQDLFHRQPACRAARSWPRPRTS